MAGERCQNMYFALLHIKLLMKSRKEGLAMIIFKLIGKIAVLHIVFVLSCLCITLDVLTVVYCHVAGFVFNLLLLFIFLTFITSQWTALEILGILLVAFFILYFTVGTVLAVIESSRAFFVGILRG